jgi:phosphomethylpyrimidine synthase
MCGHDWCSVRISKEIEQFVSGKDEDYQWDRAKVTAALTDEQREVLEKRGVLSPDEIHRLASKTKQGVGASEGAKAACHSDLVDKEEAERLQDEKLVQVNVAPAYNVSKHDSLV